MNREEAIKIVKSHYPANKQMLNEALEFLIPELKEDEDELTWLKNYISEEAYYLSMDIRGDEDRIKLKKLQKSLAWLEKQGEQKPKADFLLSWNKDDEKMFRLIETIIKDYWTKAENENNELKIKDASDVLFFLKTIQKSPLCWIKCSDGLPNKDGVYLVVTDGLYNEVYDLARYDSIDGWHKASEILYWMPIPQLNNKSLIESKSDERKDFISIPFGAFDSELVNETITIPDGCVATIEGRKIFIKRK